MFYFVLYLPDIYHICIYDIIAVKTTGGESTSRTLLLTSTSRHPWASNSATSAATAAITGHTIALIHSRSADVFGSSRNIWLVILIWSNSAAFMDSSPEPGNRTFFNHRQCRRRWSSRTGSWASEQICTSNRAMQKSTYFATPL